MLPKVVTGFFDAKVRSRGEQSNRRGEVQICESEPDSQVLAVVNEGRATEETSLDIVHRSGKCTIKVWCTCEAFRRGDTCAHIYATLLTAEEEGLIGNLPGHTTIELDEDENDDLDDDDGFVAEEYAPEAEAGWMSRLANVANQYLLGHSSAGGNKASPSPPEWSVVLNGLARQASETSPPEPVASRIEPYYVLDPDAHDRYGRHLPTASPFRLTVMHQTVTASGRLGKLKKLGLRAEHIPQLTTDLDRQICLLLMGAAEQDTGYGYYRDRYGYPSCSTYNVPRESRATLLPLLFSTGRFRYKETREDPPMPLVRDEGAPWELEFAFEPGKTKDQFLFTPRLHRHGKTLPLLKIDHVIDDSPAYFVCGGVLSRMNAYGCQEWVAVFSQRGPVVVKEAERAAFLKTIDRLPQLPPIRWPREWNIVEVTDLAPRPYLSLTLKDGGGYERQRYGWGTLAFQYDDAEVNAFDRVSYINGNKGKRRIRRQIEVERQYMARLAALGCDPDRYLRQYKVYKKGIPSLVCALLKEGWTVQGDAARFRNPGEFKIDATSGIDWFELKGGLDFEGQQASLPDLLAALKKGERFVQLGDGSMGLVPEEWLAKYGKLLGLGKAEDGGLRFARTQLTLIDMLLAEMPEATFDDNLRAARARLRDFEGVASLDAPAGFNGTLRDYQRDGLGWLSFLDGFGWGGCLADDMGLGKTIQVLAMLLHRKRQGKTGPALVVVPKSLVFNWMREAAAFTPDLKMLEYYGSGRCALRDKLAESDVVITTYGTLRRDIEQLRKIEFDYLILDEAQAIKNPSSQSAKAARLLFGRRRLTMTGTPVENHLGDLWSQFEFLNPGLLGSVKVFNEAFNTRRNGDSLETGVLQRMLRPFILRRTKAQVARELPERVEQTIRCVMPPPQQKHYDELLKYYRASLLGRVEEEGIAKSKIYVLEALLRLRQAACHPGLIDEAHKDCETAKLETLIPMVTELIAEDHKALVFSQFTSMLALVHEPLDRAGIVYEYLDGQTEDRQKRVDRFQNDPACPLFLISLKAGGAGLNLTAADYVFILDPWWNPAVEAQAIDRTHRIGQDKKVIAYRLIAQNTVEERILDLQKSKRALSEAIITEANSVIRDLTREDLALLLS